VNSPACRYLPLLQNSSVRRTLGKTLHQKFTEFSACMGFSRIIEMARQELATSWRVLYGR
jgi:hypothetical protein